MDKGRENLSCHSALAAGTQVEPKTEGKIMFGGKRDSTGEEITGSLVSKDRNNMTMTWAL